MSQCEGCGAPLKLRVHACEYCRRQINQCTVIDSQSGEVSERYSTGWSDPRWMFGSMSQDYNAQQQAAARDAFNQQMQSATVYQSPQNASPFFQGQGYFNRDNGPFWNRFWSKE